MDAGLPFPYNSQENCVLFDLDTVISTGFGSQVTL